MLDSKLTRILFHWLLASMVWLVLCRPSLALGQRDSSEGATKPNIVVFIADDLGQRDCSPYASSAFPTPSMQLLAERGITFERAYVASPSCAPSRAALLTAMMPAKNGAQSNHTKPRPDIQKWPTYFQNLGYEVVAFGKVSHYQHTADYGFDHFAHDKFHDHAGIPAAVEFLRERSTQKNPKPLCILVGSNWPHVPWPKLPEGYQQQTWELPAGSLNTPATQRWRSRYAAAVEKADKDLQTILQATEKYLPNNTVFMFTSDHGAQWPFGKWNLYEAGVRVPLIVSWPNQIKAGIRTQAMVSWIDVLPTLHEIAGGEEDKNWDGRSFLEVLTHSRETHREYIFTTHSNDSRMNVYPMRAVCDKRWKFIRNLHPEYAFTTHLDLVGGADGQRKFFSTWETLAKNDSNAAEILRRYHQRPEEELYDLSVDPNEQNNLAGDPRYEAELTRMRQVLSDWRDQHDALTTLKVEPRLLEDSRSYGPAAEIKPPEEQNEKRNGKMP